MLYRRGPFGSRKFAHPGENSTEKNSINQLKTEQSRELETIPLPNEGGEPSFEDSRAGKRRNAFFLKNLINRISFEEIIILGLILLLFNESVEDDFLPVILIYILLAGLN